MRVKRSEKISYTMDGLVDAVANKRFICAMCHGFDFCMDQIDIAAIY